MNVVATLLYGLPLGLALTAAPAPSVSIENLWSEEEVGNTLEGRFRVEDWSVAGLVVGKHTLDDARGVFGPADLVPDFSERGAHGARICYRFDDGIVALFESSDIAELHRGITGIVLIDANFVPFVSRCAAAGQGSSPEVRPGTAIGTPRTTFESAIGIDPGFRDAAMGIWGLKKSDGEWITLSGLRALFVNERVVAWWVYLYES